MGRKSRKKESSDNRNQRPYDMASIRHLSIEEQVRHRKVKLDIWLRLRENEGKTGSAAAKIVGIPERTLYSWLKKPIPESTRPHNFRTSSKKPKL